MVIIKAINEYRNLNSNIFESKIYMQEWAFIVKAQNLREQALLGSRKAAKQLLKLLAEIK